jgi:erythronate-4-phosphate dehydrogenase
VSSLKIVADQQILLAKEVFSKFGELELLDGRSIDQKSVQDADVLLVRSVTKVNESLLKNSKVTFVGSATSGIDHIDTDYLEKSNITFSQALGSNARSVAEYVLSSLLITAEQQGFALTDKTVGIIGCGQVGSRVKRFMEVLGVKCLINDPPLAQQTSNHDFVELKGVFEADIISLHVPLIMDGEYPSYKLVNKDFLNKLKPDITIINSSRGEVIDEAALLAFKDANSSSSLILDVWCNEPEIDVNLLQKTFIATPHIAGYSYDGKLKATEMLFDALNKHLQLELARLKLLNSEQEIMNIDDDAIQLAVLQSYDVRSDAIALASLIDVEAGKRAAYFDSLRKNYPIRREFTNRMIQTTNMSHETKQQLQQLGFTIKSI